ncbi:nucleotidyl transferase AbiEii/AbiGii toxin family protein [Kitasatospora sp. NPDC088346]|uniref:nucleotidyl transferase AbiEii/AbiGii toxin family protein n=1 Tax=Kitasatospora sp. NPDC088346 TaxID=3364073 RepID=UPI0038211BAC
MTDDRTDPSDRTGTPGAAGSAAADWDGLDYGPWEEVVLPRRPPTEEVRELLDLPRAIRPIDDDAVTQQPVFDPALAGYSRALRPSEPAFADPQVAERWLLARREALDTVLSAVAGSPWAAHLVLRGSVLLKAWYGEAAREPGDLDFVVRPEDWELEDDRTQLMIDAVAAGAERLSGRVRLHADQAASDEIWTYSRVPGRRLVLPWSAPGLPGGTVQLDFVFTEHLPAPPETAELPGVDGPLSVASRELSLAWKILWLVSDNHPQGKDLYDAVLLAESTGLSYDLLREVFRLAGEGWDARPVLPQALAGIEVDRDEFRKDHPALEPACPELPGRLAAALAPTFADRDGYTLRAHWLAPLTDELRPVLAESGMAQVQQHLAARYPEDAAWLVALAELLDGDLDRAHHLLADRFADSEYRLQRLRQAATDLAEARTRA